MNRAEYGGVGKRIRSGTFFIAKVCMLLWCFGSPQACGLVTTGQEHRFRFVSYNVQNIFDDIENGGEYSEFVPGTGRWGSAAYRARLGRLARVLRFIGLQGVGTAESPSAEPSESAFLSGGSGERAAGVTGRPEDFPEFVLLTEVESSKVIEDFVRDHLPPGTYPYRYIQEDGIGTIRIAFLSRLSVSKVRNHRIWLDGDSSRDILEAELDLSGQGAEDDKRLVVFGNHWKSKSGGEAETEPLRIAAARVLARRAEELRKDRPDLSMLVLGDLNQVVREVVADPANRGTGEVPHGFGGNSYQGFGRSLGLWHRASGPHIGAGAATDVADAAIWVFPLDKGSAPENRASVTADIPGFVWLSPWPLSGRKGSYVYDGAWEAIDHALMSVHLHDGAGLDFDGFMTHEAAFVLDEAGFPYRYDVRKGSGFSDHLAIRIDLAFPEAEAARVPPR